MGEKFYYLLDVYEESTSLLVDSNKEYILDCFYDLSGGFWLIDIKKEKDEENSQLRKIR